jgi:hypothetical protein
VSRCSQRLSIQRHFEGTISPAEEHAMREHVPGCDACGAEYQRWLVLSKLDPEGLSAETRIGRALGFGPRPIGRVVPLSVISVVSMAAAFLLCAHAGHGPDGFTARGAPHEPTSQAFVYDVAANKGPALAGGRVGRKDELAFAYVNGAGKSQLMIFGVDEHQHVYWFYPAWTDAADNPAAIPIATDGARHTLPDAVRHDFDGASLDIRALFLDAPLHVRDVESLLQQHPTGPLPIPGAMESPAHLSVSP